MRRTLLAIVLSQCYCMVVAFVADDANAMVERDDVVDQYCYCAMNLALQRIFA